MCGEKDNLESSTATGLHKGEHMGRMRMETHGYCADVGGGSGEEKSSPYGVLTTVDDPQQASRFYRLYIRGLKLKLPGGH